MIIIGEKINASRKEVKLAINEKNKEHLQKLALDQVKAGANYIDVNCGINFDKEPETMEESDACITHKTLRHDLTTLNVHTKRGHK